MESVLEPLKEFSKNSVRLVKRCTKPDRKGEYTGASCSAVPLLSRDVSQEEAPCDWT